MKWILFTGSWRLKHPDLEGDVRAAAREAFAAGDAMVTGGATGADYFAMDEWLRLDPAAQKLVVILPTALAGYAADYHRLYTLPPVTGEDIDRLDALLRRIDAANPNAIRALPFAGSAQEHFDRHNEVEAAACDEAWAFHVNDSAGTQHTLDAVRKRGKPVTRHLKYTVEDPMK